MDMKNTDVAIKKTPEPSRGLIFAPDGHGGAMLVGMGECTDEVLVIPSRTPDGLRVTSVCDAALMRNARITRIMIPKSIKSIGKYAFAWCSNLQAVTIPSSVAEIGDRAFTGCERLTRLCLRDGIRRIGERAFSFCAGLSELQLPDSIQQIGTSAFEGCRSLRAVRCRRDWKHCRIRYSAPVLPWKTSPFRLLCPKSESLLFTAAPLCPGCAFPNRCTTSVFPHLRVFPLLQS